MTWYWKVLRNYAVFSGRARRIEFWMFYLINCIIMAVLEIVGDYFGGGSGTSDNEILVIYFLAVLIPTIAVAVRRMHDTDHSGWFLLIPLVNLIFLVTDGTRGDNIYGTDPKWL